MKTIIEWHRHLFWLVGWSFWCLIQLDFDNLIDTMFWMKIHLTCKFQVSGRHDVGRKQEVINFFVILVGFAIYCLILLFLMKTILLIRSLI